MKNIFPVLLKKELYEFLKNIKFWSFILFVIIAIAVMTFLEITLPDNFNLILIVLLISQYTFDSCLNDIKSGGALFFLNIKCSVTEIIIAKMFYSLVIGTVLFFLAFAFFLNSLSISDLIWLIPLFAFTTALTYNATIITKKSDLIPSLLTGGITFLILESITKLKVNLLRSVILIMATIIVTILASTLSKTVSYRTEISRLK